MKFFIAVLFMLVFVAGCGDNPSAVSEDAEIEISKTNVLTANVVCDVSECTGLANLVLPDGWGVQDYGDNVPTQAIKRTSSCELGLSVMIDEAKNINDQIKDGWTEIRNGVFRNDFSDFTQNLIFMGEVDGVSVSVFVTGTVQPRKPDSLVDCSDNDIRLLERDLSSVKLENN